MQKPPVAKGAPRVEGAPPIVRGQNENRPGANPPRIDGAPPRVGEARPRGPNAGANPNVGPNLNRGEVRHRADFGPRTPSDNRVRIGNRDVRIGGTNYRPAFAQHRWYRGNWGGYGGWGQWGGPGYNWGYSGSPGYYGWRGRPLGWGLGAWGLGSLIYSSGYLPYYNPFFGGDYVGSGVYNYSEPIPVVYDSAYVPPASAEQLLSEAMAAFRRNDTNTALELMNRAVAESPNDPALHEFRALVLFAKSDYGQAAATIHSVLALGPGWDWATLSSFYPDVAVYTLQLRALEQFVDEHPRDPAGRFLLAYHYLSIGHPQAAVGHLEIVVEQFPEDRVAKDLLKMVSQFKSGGTASTDVQPSPEPPEATLPATQGATLEPGVWNASRPDGSRFELTLTPDPRFTWKFTPRDQRPVEFSGTYSIDGKILAMERPEGGSLVGEVTPREGRGFLFKMVGAPSDDPGLEFK